VSNDGAYTYREIEKKWRTHWVENKTFKTPSPGDPEFDSDRPKHYVLDMFPYASGAGLHIGHQKGYIATDAYCRYKRMRGFNVLHPMGFDSFGLPTEQYARQNNVHPAVATEQFIANVREQFQTLGMSYDWDREIATSRPGFYRWTQWIFSQMFNSWFDPQHEWTDAAGRQITGKGRPVAELVTEFEAGHRQLSHMDETAADIESGGQWTSLTEVQRASVLNNYRIVYQKEVTVNWCPALGTVLANEEVTSEGRSEVGDLAVYQRPLAQWVMRITDYADRLLEDLDVADLPDGQGGTYCLDWPAAIKLMQRNWIGRSSGAEVLFDVLKPGSDEVATRLDVFTTRPDTLFGATFMVVAPEHPIVDVGDGDDCLVPSVWPAETRREWKGADSSLEIRAAVSAYLDEASNRTAQQEREEREKTGVFAGIYALNPVTGGSIPIFIADYVSMDYGTGAIMAVPAHDERDYEFAVKYGIDVVRVVEAPPGAEADGECFAGEGVSVNSPSGGSSQFEINGQSTAEAILSITAALEAASLGKAAVSYKLRDWIFSRQWYWGEPFPLATHPDGHVVETALPVLLPEMEDFKPETSDDPNSSVTPPLSRADESWLSVDIDGVSCRRELNVMPQWAGSCWYFLRFIDPHNEEAFCGEESEHFFMPVDLYVGGAEHAVLHLLYARFWHKVLFDLGHVSSPEPFKRLINQGMITADAFADSRGTYIDIRQVAIRDGEPFHRKTDEKLTRFAGKMGKRYKNGLPPEEVGEEYGVDTLRLYEMYMGPLEASAPWSMEGIRGMQRFLHRVWRNFVDRDGTPKLSTPDETPPGLEKLLHKTVVKVSDDIDGLRFNTAIAALIELNNELVGVDGVSSDLARTFLRLISPMAPHLAEELWQIYGFGSGDLSSQPWPEADESLLVEETIVLPIQVNGKVRSSVEVPLDIDQISLRALVLSQENVKKHVADESAIRKFIVVPGKIINIVV